MACVMGGGIVERGWRLFWVGTIQIRRFHRRHPVSCAWDRLRNLQTMIVHVVHLALADRPLLQLALPRIFEVGLPFVHHSASAYREVRDLCRWTYFHGAR